MKFSARTAIITANPGSRSHGAVAGSYVLGLLQEHAPTHDRGLQAEPKEREGRLGEDHGRNGEGQGGDDVAREEGACGAG